jgi:hypothetical protein
MKYYAIQNCYYGIINAVELAPKPKILTAIFCLRLVKL